MGLPSFATFEWVSHAICRAAVIKRSVDIFQPPSVWDGQGCAWRGGDGGSKGTCTGGCKSGYWRLDRATARRFRAHTNRLEDRRWRTETDGPDHPKERDIPPLPAHRGLVPTPPPPPRTSSLGTGLSLRQNRKWFPKCLWHYFTGATRPGRRVASAGAWQHRLSLGALGMVQQAQGCAGTEDMRS